MALADTELSSPHVPDTAAMAVPLDDTAPRRRGIYTCLPLFLHLPFFPALASLLPSPIYPSSSSSYLELALAPSSSSGPSPSSISMYSCNSCYSHVALAPWL